MILHNSDDNRVNLHKLHTEYIKFLKMEESILKQKSQLHWFNKGDANTKYFHALLSGRRRKLFIHQMQDENRDWIHEDDRIANAAYRHFQHIFTVDDSYISEDVLTCIPNMVTQGQNDLLQRMPDHEEVKQAIFYLSSHSASGPDGMNGRFFQDYWSIINQDLFSCGSSFLLWPDFS